SERIVAASASATPKRISTGVVPAPHDARKITPSTSAGSKISGAQMLVRRGNLGMSNLTTRNVSLLLAALLSCCIFPAAADDGKPRYVSGAGRDEGDCLNRFRPCRTLSYAITQSGKGDSIQVAEGTYVIRQSAQLFDLLSATGRVNAGFSKVSSYSERNARNDTLLIGVPPEFRERFEAAGFT